MEAHTLNLMERQKLTMTGVQEVLSFDESTVVLQTELGMLTVQGRQLQLKTLSVEGGRVEVCGEVAGLLYEQPRQSWFRRILG